MQAQRGGRICNVVGAAARNPTATYLPGGAANAALINFTKGLADLEKTYPLGRIATSEDIADVVTFLVSARASFITGICVTVDGGATRGVYP